jgi:hypothetical protein
MPAPGPSAAGSGPAGDRNPGLGGDQLPVHDRHQSFRDLRRGNGWGERGEHHRRGAQGPAERLPVLIVAGGHDPALAEEGSPPGHQPGNLSPVSRRERSENLRPNAGPMPRPEGAVGRLVEQASWVDPPRLEHSARRARRPERSDGENTGSYPQGDRTAITPLSPLRVACVRPDPPAKVAAATGYDRRWHRASSLRYAGLHPADDRGRH